MSDTKLTNVIIYRWHSIEKEIITFIEGTENGNAMFYGENASGKSVRLDALTFAHGYKVFNRAACEKDERTVNSYIRGVGTKNEIKTGTVYSNIAMEWTHRTNEKVEKYVIGVHSTSQTSKDLPKIFWYIAKCPADKLKFEQKDGEGFTVLDWNQFKNTNAAYLSPSSYTNVQKTAKRLIFARLHNMPVAMCTESMVDTFEDAFLKSVASRSPQDVQTFIRDIFIDKPIDVSSLQKTCINLNNIWYDIEAIKAEKQKIQIVNSKGDAFEKADFDFKARDCAVSRACMIKAKESIENDKKDIIFCENEDAGAIKEMQRQKSLRDNLIKELANLSDGNEDALKRNIENFKSNAEMYKKNLLTVRKQIDNYNKAVDFIQSSLNEALRGDVSLPPLPATIEALLTPSYDEENVSKDIATAKENIDACRVARHITETVISNAKNKTNAERVDLIKEKRLLEEGAVRYPDNTFRFLTVLNSELKKEGCKEEAKVLCDLVEDVSRPKWAPVLETFLGHNRFAIIVPPQYAKMAQHLLSRMSNTKHVKVVTTNLLKPIEKINEHSLFSLVSVTNPYAERYLYFLLNKVTMCNDIDDFAHCRRGVTANGLFYSNFATEKKQLEKSLCLGQTAKKEQLELVKKQIQKKEEMLKLCESNLSSLKELNQLLQRIDFSDIAKPEYYDAYNRREQELAHVEELHKALEILRTSPEHAKLQSQKEKIERDIAVADNALERARNKDKELCADIRNKKQNISRNKEIAEENEIELNRKLNEYGLNISETDKFLNYAGSTLSKYKAQAEQLAISLRRAMRDVGKDSLGYEVSDLYKYRARFNEIKSVESERLDRKLKEEIENFKSDLKNDICEGLLLRIDAAKKLTQQINRISKKAFVNMGDDTYYGIRIAGTTDDDLKPLYELISKKDPDEKMIFDDEDNVVLDKLVEFMLSLQNEDSEDEISKFCEKCCDYRNLLSYDVYLYDEAAGTRTSIKEKGKTNSGYETQAIYYILTAASLYSLCQKDSEKSDAALTILIDEAFSCCDDNNIRKMMRFFKEINAQLIIAIPFDRHPHFIDYVDNAFIISNKLKGIELHNLTKEEIQKRKEGKHIDAA